MHATLAWHGQLRRQSNTLLGASLAMQAPVHGSVNRELTRHGTVFTRRQSPQEEELVLMDEPEAFKSLVVEDTLSMIILKFEFGYQPCCLYTMIGHWVANESIYNFALSHHRYSILPLLQKLMPTAETMVPIFAAHGCATHSFKLYPMSPNECDSYEHYS